MRLSHIKKLLREHSLYDLTIKDGAARDVLTSIPAAEAAVALNAIITDESLAHEIRFKACETAFSLPGVDLDTPGRALAATIYAREMADGATHSIWGLPGQPSTVARNVLRLGKELVLPALRPLLANQRSLTYEGSQEPTLSHARGYRVADLAGSLAASLLGKRFPASEDDPTVRDKALAELRDAIAHGPR